MDEAIAWHVGLEEAGAEAWHDFVAWLEGDPAHAEAYDRLTLQDAEVVEAFREAPAPLRPAAVRIMAPGSRYGWMKRTGWGGGMVAAAAAAWLALMPAALPPSDPYSVSTGPGMRRLVTLSDGTKIAMNGDTTLTLDRNRPRIATLDRGEAMFDVVHHADRPFELRVAGMTLRDVGTRFNVVRDSRGLGVAVAEGSVLFQPDREAVPLTPGMTLSRKAGADRLELGRTDAVRVGGWALGRLDYRNAALADVAGDVARSTGARIRIADALATRPFTGTLRVDRAPDQVVRSLAALAGVNARRDGPGWVIAARSAGAS